MEKIKNYLIKVPSQFWLNNGLLALMCYFITSHHFLHIFLFPLAVLMVRYVTLKYFKDISVKYVGAYPLKNDLKWALITFMVSFVIFETAIIILILGALFILWQENKAYGRQ